MKKVFILTEGGKNIGFGHITRCKSIYQAFQEKDINPEFIVNGDESVTDLIDDTNYKIFNWIIEKDKLFSLLENSDIAIIDSYLADYDIYKNISNITKSPVYIDDNNRLEYPAGTVVNGSINAKKLDYPENENINYLLGIKYFPLRKAFWNVPNKKINNEIESVMITFGGDDKRELTPKIVKIVRDKLPQTYIDVVIGKGFSEKNINEIKNIKDKKINLCYNLTSHGMKDIMIKNDIAISASGQTLYELAKVGLPVISISIVKNQLNNVKGWEVLEYIDYAGWWENSDISFNIKNSLNKLRSRRYRKKKFIVARKKMKNNGAINIIDELDNLIL